MEPRTFTVPRQLTKRQRRRMARTLVEMLVDADYTIEITGTPPPTVHDLFKTARDAGSETKGNT